MELPARLRAVASRVPQGSVAVDVGADHALLAAHLLASRRCCRVIATERAPQPLDRARRNLAALGVQGVDLRLGDGLGPLVAGEADVAVIAGLGADSITAILARHPRRVARLILQPMTGTPRLRGWLAGHGFRVTDEDLVEDGGRLYEVLVADPGGPGDGQASYPPLDGFRRTAAGTLSRTLLLEVGPLLLARGHPLLPRRLTAMAEQRERAAAAASGARGPRGRRARALLVREGELLRSLAGRCGG